MKEAVYNELRAKLPRILDTPKGMTYSEWIGPELTRLSDELDCIDMLRSIFAYHDADNRYEAFFGDSPGRDYSYAQTYIDRLGLERVNELYFDFKKYFEENCYVIKNSGQDSEGIWYNSLMEIKKEEQNA